MSIQSAQQFVFGFWQGRPVQVEQVDENLSSDGGLMPFWELDQKLRWTESFTRQFNDRRVDPLHSALSIVRQRVFGILAGYEDQNDHDTLRSDPIFKLIAGRTPEADDLASQPTISRLENAITAGDLLQLEDWFIDRFVESFASEPTRITLDIDTFDAATHGDQQLTFFHGFYDQYQYQVRVITCADNDMTVLPVLLFGTAAASLGAADDLQRVIERLRARFPDVQIYVRADSGFATPQIYETLEQFPGVTYSIGYKMNPRLQRESAALLQQSASVFAASGVPQRDFMTLDCSARSWSVSRPIVVKCEVTALGSNRRAVVTNRAGVQHFPDGVYDEYADRGESENRNKELKCELSTDRLSDHRYMANLFRVMMHVLSANLLVQMRRIVAQPPAAPPDSAELPPEARTAYQKRQQHNRRRRLDPLGEGHACTWRTHVIKVAARVIVTTRRVRILISGSWPFADYLRQVSRQLAAFSPHFSSG